MLARDAAASDFVVAVVAAAGSAVATFAPDDVSMFAARASTFVVAAFVATPFVDAGFVPAFVAVAFVVGAGVSSVAAAGCIGAARCVFCTGFSAAFFSERPLPSSIAPAPASARSTSSTNTINPIGRRGGTTSDRDASGVEIGGRCDVDNGSPSRGVAANDSEPGCGVGILSAPGGGVWIGVAARWKLLCGGTDAGLFDGGIEPGTAG